MTMFEDIEYKCALNHKKTCNDCNECIICYNCVFLQKRKDDLKVKCKLKGEVVEQYYKVVLRVWIEGEDKTCTTEVYGKQTDKYKLNLEFVIDSDTNGITKIGSEVEGG